MELHTCPRYQLLVPQRYANQADLVKVSLCSINGLFTRFSHHNLQTHYFLETVSKRGCTYSKIIIIWHVKKGLRVQKCQQIWKWPLHYFPNLPAYYIERLEGGAGKFPIYKNWKVSNSSYTCLQIAQSDPPRRACTVFESYGVKHKQKRHMQITTGLLRPHSACSSTVEATEVTTEAECRLCLKCYLTNVRLKELARDPDTSTRW